MANFQKLRDLNSSRGPSTFLYIDIITAALMLIYFQVFRLSKVFLLC